MFLLKARRPAALIAICGVAMTIGYMLNVIVELHTEQALMQREQVQLRSQVAQLLSVRITSPEALVVQRPTSVEKAVEPLPLLDLSAPVAAKHQSAFSKVGALTSAAATQSPLHGTESRLKAVEPPQMRAEQPEEQRSLPGKRSARARHLSLMKVGANAGFAVGDACFTIGTGASQTIDVSAASCNSKNCPTCFIVPAVAADVSLTISTCSTARWPSGTDTTVRTGAWDYTFINLDTADTVGITDGTATYRLAAQSFVHAHCAEGGSNRLYFPSTTWPLITVEGAVSVTSMTVATTSTLAATTVAATLTTSDAITTGATGHITMAANGVFSQSGTGTFKTTAGINLNGDVALASGKNLGLSGGGDVSIADAGHFTLGTGSISKSSGSIAVASSVTIAINKGLTTAGSGGITIGGSGAFAMSTSSGAFSTGTGTVSFKGHTTIASPTAPAPAGMLNMVDASGQLNIGAGGTMECAYVDVITDTPQPPVSSHVCTDGR